MTYKKGGKQPNQLPYNKTIANKVRELAPTHSIAKIHEAILHMQYAPKSYTTFYKLYGKDLSESRGDVAKAMGDKIINTGLNGDEDSPYTHKSRELYMTTMGGWSKKETVETREVGNEYEDNEGAVNALLAALGKAVDDEE